MLRFGNIEFRCTDVIRYEDILCISEYKQFQVVRLRCKKIGQASHVTFHGGKPVLEGVN